MWRGLTFLLDGCMTSGRRTKPISAHWATVTKGLPLASANDLSSSMKSTCLYSKLNANCGCPETLLSNFLFYWKTVHKLNFEEIEKFAFFRTSNYFSGLLFVCLFTFQNRLRPLQFWGFWKRLWFEDTQMEMFAHLSSLPSHLPCCTELESEHICLSMWHWKSS